MLAKICLDEGVDAPGLIGRKVNGYAAEAEMADGVQVYLNAVRAELEPGDLLLVEQPFSLDRLRPPGEMFGTADAVIYKPGLRRLLVFDLKYGAGIVVEALGNPQGRYYGLGACMALADCPVSEVEIVIVQPRARIRPGPFAARRSLPSSWSSGPPTCSRRRSAPLTPRRPWWRARGAGSARSRDLPGAARAGARNRAGRVCCGAAPRRLPRRACRPRRPGASWSQPSWPSSGSGAARPCACRARGGTEHSWVEAGPEAPDRRWRDEEQAVVELQALGLPEDELIPASSRALPRSRSWLAQPQARDR